MTQALASAVKRPAFFPAPGFALKAAFGKMAEELLLQGQQALPKRALSEGFEFEFESLAPAMADAVAKKRLATKGG
jgi:NAD dependent epimerase/dehydratase family enzyme